MFKFNLFVMFGFETMVTECCYFSFTALHIAALCGKQQLIEVLLRHRADLSAGDYLGCTPLHISCQRGHHTVSVSVIVMALP